MITHNLKYYGVDLEVSGTYYSYKHSTYDTPPEPEEFEIEKVTINGADVTELLEDHINNIETEILQNIYG